MAIFDKLFEEIELTIDGVNFLATFNAEISYSTEGHGRHCRVDEVFVNPQAVTLMLTYADGDNEGERADDLTLAIPGDTGLGGQVQAAIYEREDDLRDDAAEDLQGEYANACEAAYDARRDDRACGF